MPSKKQRRRREKLKRHEWEEVYVDADGNEIDADEAAGLIEPAKAAKGKSAGSARSARARRAVEPPSWKRTAKRGALFFPLMLIVVFVLGAKDETTVAQKVVSTLFLMAFFLPFSYFLDTMVWRATQRRLNRADERKPRDRKKR